MLYVKVNRVNMSYLLGKCRDALALLSKTVMPSNRLRMYFFSNIIKCHKRSDPQSSCAECARKVLARLRRFHTEFPNTSLYYVEKECGVRDTSCSEFVSSKQQGCIEAKANVMEILDVVHDSNQAVAVGLFLKDGSSSSSDFDGKKTEDPKVGSSSSSGSGFHRRLQRQERYLSQYKCNVLALMILEEAYLQLEESSNSTNSSGANGFDKFCLSSTDSYVLESIGALIAELKSSTDYKSKTNIDVVDEKIRLFQIKFGGHGMEYLKELSKIKNSYLYC